MVITYWNWTTLQSGPNRMPPWNNQIDLDGVYFQSGYVPDSNLPVFCSLINYGPFVTRGGRHTITLTADPSDQVPESDETNNTWNGQWVWSPLAMVKDSPALRDQAPARGLLTHPNCDGFQFTQPDTRYAWVVSMAPLGFGDDYDLIVYDDYIGSTAGFSNQRAYSNLGSYSTDFVVGHYTSFPTTVYPAVIGYSETGPGDSFAFDQTDASTHNFSGNAQYPHQNLGAYRLADVFAMLRALGMAIKAYVCLKR